MKIKIQNLKNRLQNAEDIDEMFPELETFQHELYNAGYEEESSLLYWCLCSYNCDINDIIMALNMLERLIV